MQDNTNMVNHDPTVRLGKAYLHEKDEINRKYRGQVRKARLMIADLTYGLGMIEGNLGVESVRENWRKHIDRMWRCGRADDTAARQHLLMVIDCAAECYVEPRVAGSWKRPRSRDRIEFLTDANGVTHHLLMDLPHMDEAAAEGIAFVARFDPELAATIPVADIEKIVPIWLDRRNNTGRRGKKLRIDEALCLLVKKLGYAGITAEAMRRQRLAWEKTYPSTAAEPEPARPPKKRPN